MRRILLTSWAIVLAGAAAAQSTVPYASPAELTDAAGESTPGVLHWHRYADGAPYLSISDLDGGRSEVRDRAALHRVTLAEIRPPQYSVELGDGVTVSNGWFVLFDNRPNDNAIVTRQVTLVPTPEYRIVSCQVSNARQDPAKVKIDAGRAIITRSSQQPPPGLPSYTDCAFAISLVMAAAANDAEARDDLTRGDYLFSDAVGDSSLGDIRPWTLRQLAGHRGDDWSRYPASSMVRLGGQPVVVDALAQFRIESGVESDSRDRMTLYAGSSPAVELSLGAEANGGNGAVLRIMRFEFDRETRRVEMSVTAIGENHVIIGTDSALTDDPILWRDLETTRLLGTTTIDGVTCYTLQATVPDTWDMAFFRAGCDIDDSNPTTLSTLVPVVAREGVILRSPNGTLWRLSVANDGTLSTEAY